MPDRSTPLERAILHTLDRDATLSAEEVFARIGPARPDVSDAAIVSAVRFAVARNLERLADEGWVARQDDGYVLGDASVFAA